MKHALVEDKVCILVKEEPMATSLASPPTQQVSVLCSNVIYKELPCVSACIRSYRKVQIAKTPSPQAAERLLMERRTILHGKATDSIRHPAIPLPGIDPRQMKTHVHANIHRKSIQSSQRDGNNPNVYPPVKK